MDPSATSFGFNSIEPERYICYVTLALVSSAMRLTRAHLPGGTSMSFLFVLVSLIELSTVDTLLIGAFAILITSPIQAERRNRLQLTMTDLLSMGAGTLGAHAVFKFAGKQPQTFETAAVYVAASAACFLAMALPAHLITDLTAKPGQTRTSEVPDLLSMVPFYLVSGVVTGIFAAGASRMGWQTLALYLPVATLLWHLYKLSIRRLEIHKTRRQEIEGLHMRTIETLALAIGARDQEMSKHLERVQVYAVELAKSIGLSRDEIEALKTAALLHDIGKLAVPDHILSKPGRLTSEEFERMKVHPAVGAEILARAEFPYPVAPIVRHHHERWDGTGYPDGLRGDAIPIGARILTVVDCLDALASDRQYRRALPIDDAVVQIAAGSGKQFDPKIIARLRMHYKEWETMVERMRSERVSAPLPAEAPPVQVFENVVRTINSASTEVNQLFELTQDLGNSLSFENIFSTLTAGLKRLLPYSALAVYTVRRSKLTARQATGFAATPELLELEIETSLSGTVAKSGQSCLNGNPGEESTDPLVSIYFRAFRSALSVAIPGPASNIGVITLYHVEPGFFTSDHLRVLQALLPKVSQALVNGMQFQMAEARAGTDHLTGLPNAHTLYLQLDREIGLNRFMSTPLAVVVCDLNGFKLINDTLGHLVGNQLLQAVGAALRDTCREYDFVARMGGDEFVIILSGLYEADATKKIVLLREAIKASSAQICKGAPVSGSFGLAMYPADALTADELLACADRNMYRDKEVQQAMRSNATAGIKSWAARRTIAAQRAKPQAAPVPTSSQTPSASPLSSLKLAPGKDS